MRLNIPLFGQVNVGRESASPAITTVDLPKTKQKTVTALLGALLDFGGRSLSNQRTISTKLLDANKEWVYRNNDVIAQEVSKMEFQLYSVGLSKGEIVFKEVDEHPLLDLLDGFNDETSRMDGIYITQSDKKLAGDAFWYLEREGKDIKNVRILIPDQVEIEFNKDGSDQLINNYKYTEVVDKKRTEVHYEPEDIIHFKKPNPQNPFRGKGAVEALADTIDADNLTALTQMNFFRKGAISNFVLTTDNNLTDEQIKRLRAEFRAAYTGANNAYKTMIFGNGLKPSDIGFSNKDMQFLDILEWYRDKIMIGFGNTKASIGIIDDVNRASFEGSHAAWLSATVKPDMDSIVNTLNEYLVPKFGDKLILGYKNPIKEDRAAEVKEATELKKSGVIMINEAREILDYEPVPGGDIFAPDSAAVATPNQEPQDNKPPKQPDPPKQDEDEEDEKIYRRPSYAKAYSRRIKNVPPSLAHLDVNGILRKRKIFTDRQINKELKDSVKPMIRKVLERVNGKKNKDDNRIHAQFTNDQITSYYEKQMNVVDVMENQFEDAVRQFIGKIEQDTLNNIENEISTIRGFNKFVKGRKQLFSEENLLLEAQVDLYPLLMQEVLLAGQEAMRLIGSEDIYTPLKLREVVRENVAKFTQSMLNTDRDAMIDIIRNGLDAGSSIPEIRQAMTDKFTDLKQYQTERITRTEVLRASNLAAQDAFEQSGVVEAKQWLVAPGAEERCLQYAGRIVKLKDGFYDPDSSGFQDGNPPLHISCRCVLIPIVVGTTGVKQDFSREMQTMHERMKELESQVDKRTKAYKDIKSEHADDKAYIKALEKHLGVEDD